MIHSPGSTSKVVLNSLNLKVLYRRVTSNPDSPIWTMIHLRNEKMASLRHVYLRAPAAFTSETTSHRKCIQKILSSSLYHFGLSTSSSPTHFPRSGFDLQRWHLRSSKLYCSLSQLPLSLLQPSLPLSQLFSMPKSPPGDTRLRSQEFGSQQEREPSASEPDSHTTLTVESCSEKHSRK